MSDLSSVLIEELKTLRKGRGVYATHIGAQTGPVLRALCAIDDDSAASMRGKLAQRLGEIAGTLPDDLELAVTVAIALHPRARYAFLTQRVRWLAEQIGRDDRTVRRRMDEAIGQLAEAAAPWLSDASLTAKRASEHFYVEEFSAVLVLDRQSPEAVEWRRIVARQDGIDQIPVSISLPRDPSDRSATRDLLGEVLYGGNLVTKEHTSDSEFRFALDLPRPLRAGDKHEYAMTFRVPRDQPMRTHYVYTSPRRCDLFDLRIRFSAQRLPEQVWRVSGAFHRAIDDAEPTGEFLHPDKAGELHLCFRDLMPGFGYGAQWTVARDHTTTREDAPSATSVSSA
ncbi:MAG: hypothetical protein ACRDQ5_24175 [Sciscionella sp.]